jgi:GT2 family glycosyltransferase
MILIKNKDNYGFAGGNNVGIKFALDVLNPKYILLLNNDTVVDKDFLIEMVKVAESDEKIGIVGSKIYYYDYNGRDDVIWVAGGEYFKFKFFQYTHGRDKLDSETYNSEKKLDMIFGCSMLIKKNVLKKGLFFDEKFFLCFEDTDISTNAIKMGYNCIYAPKSKLWHKVGVSGDASPACIYYLTRNRILYNKKHQKFYIYSAFLTWFLTWVHLRRILQFIKKPILLKYYYLGLYDGILKKYGKKEL